MHRSSGLVRRDEPPPFPGPRRTTPQVSWTGFEVASPNELPQARPTGREALRSNRQTGGLQPFTTPIPAKWGEAKTARESEALMGANLHPGEAGSQSPV